MFPPPLCCLPCTRGHIGLGAAGAGRALRSDTSRDGHIQLYNRGHTVGHQMCVYMYVCMRMWGRTAKAVEPVCQEEKVLPRDTAVYTEMCRGGHRKGPGVSLLCIWGGVGWMPYGVQRVHTAQWGWEAAEEPCGVCACTGGREGHTAGTGGRAQTAWASWCLWRLAARCTGRVMGQRGNTELYKVPPGTPEQGECGVDGDGGFAMAWQCPGTGCFSPARMEQEARRVCNEQE